MNKPFATEESRWQAVLAHDVRADGLFWYGVKSTGIYCRPACPSRRPKRQNVSFYDSPLSAEGAGFRACLRCQPQKVGAAVRAVARAQQLLDTAEVPPTLGELAAAVGLSPFYLQRVFKARLGLSPKQYAMRQRTEKLKAALRGGQSVTAALYGAGHDSPASVYAKPTDQLGMSPREYQTGGAGQMIYYTVTQSQLGPMLVGATGRGLCAVRFGEPAAMTAELRAEYSQADLVEDAAPLQPYLEGLAAHLAGQNPALSLPTDAAGTAFQQQVWAALRQIPYGETRSYSELAQMIGAPSAVRAVARACATNPVALVVPCHRIVRRGGELGGYRWGVERKQRLLEQEQGAGSAGPLFS
ncbi:bifunctional transcriptional activator/DNA repair enzyme Ada [Deinococcus xinjiangensis]|uniref:Bifunctional transcriptional activator/DNA repair enzyme Ada n=1 Tax=Deinococcus xinjiangensis TaxID=457454 RepID=A0ABP9VFK0_9DEIO